VNEHPFSDLYRALAIHQAHWAKKQFDAGVLKGAAEPFGRHLELVEYQALWLTKFPLHFTPRFDIKALDEVVKGKVPDPETAEALFSAVYADVLRFVLSIRPAQWDERVELFFSARALNKPLWSLLAIWFEHSAALRGQIDARSDLLSTVYD